jgi:hypothetical protein
MIGRFAIRLSGAMLLASLGWSAAAAEPPAPPPPQGAPSRARVVIVEDSEAVSAFEPRLERVQAMVDLGVKQLTGKPTAAAAWLSLVSPRDKVGLKVFSGPGRFSGTRPAVVESVVRGLIAAGVPARNIIIWDRRLVDLRLAGFVELGQRLGVRVASTDGSEYDPDQFYDSPLMGRLVFGDLEFGKKGEAVGRRSHVSKLISREMTRIISIPPLLNHNTVGVSGNLLGLSLDSVDNTLRFELDPERLFQAVPEIYALPILGDRVVLNLVDALICQYEGGERGLLHYSARLNQLRFSTDPVALDVLSLEELERQRTPPDSKWKEKFLDLYRNASLLEIGVSEPRAITVERVP